MQVSLQYAAEHLAELASAARRGEEVEIAQPDEPPIKLVVSTSAPFTPKPKALASWAQVAARWLSLPGKSGRRWTKRLRAR